METVSIIIPVYNVVDYLDRCVKSVLAQTYKNIEVLLIDDGSTDGSSEKCLKYSREDTRVKYFHKDNGGVSSARNLGLDKAGGKYIMFIDADDYVDYKLVELLHTAIGQHCSMAICGMYHVRGKGIEAIFPNTNKSIINSRKEYAAVLTHWGPFCKLFRREQFVEEQYYQNGLRIGKFKNIKLSEDLDFLCDLICRNGEFNIAVVSECLYYYVMREGSAMERKYDKAVLENVKTQVDVKKRFEAENIDISGSGILRNAVEVFYYKYYSTDLITTRYHKKDLEKVNKIVKENRSYLLSLTNKINRKKMFIVIYCPFIYRLYIQYKYFRGNISL